MAIDNLLLAQLLTLSGLVAATAEYSTMIRRRVERRSQAEQQRVAESAGLQGLVRIFLVDRPT